MKTKLPTNPFCLTFGHNYFIKNNEAIYKPEIFCKSCNKQFKYSLNGNIIEIPNKQYALPQNIDYLEV